MKRWPLRWRLTFWSALITSVALLTFGAGAGIRFYLQQVHELDERLEAQGKLFFSELRALGALERADIQRVAALLKTGGELRGFAFGPETARPEFVSSDKLEPLLTAWPPERKAATVWQDKRFIRVVAATKDGRVLALFASQKPVQEMLTELASAYLMALPLVVLVVAGGSWWIARRALQPVVELTHEAAAITANRLDRRMTVPLVDDEIGQHVRVLNAMFDRLQASFEHATRFTADASHELRTPLTILRGEIESALANGENRSQEKLLIGLLEQTIQLQKIADNLLLLSRFDAGKLPLSRSRINFSELVLEAVEDADLLAAREGIAIEQDLSREIFAEGDRILLRRVLLNLVDNAVRYNRAGGTICFKLRRADGDLQLEIGNTGPGIPAERRLAVFQRFFRASEDRNSGAGGSGLGLSLCREIIAAHGGSIKLGRCEADFTEFVVRVPAIQGV